MHSLERDSTFLALGMADFQYFPDMDDPIAKLRMAMNKMDGMTAFFLVLSTHSSGST
jgi:hypothetical protein